MLILLPPSEGKTPPSVGAPLDLAKLWAPELAGVRTAVIDDLIAISSSDPDSLGAPKGARAQVEANVTLWSAPTAPASTVYTGVLFAALGIDSLDPGAAARAEAAVRISSPVYGFVAPSDPIATYRLPTTAKLPSVGPALSYLAPHVAEILDAENPALVLDCRSGPYLRLWRPQVPWVQVKAIEIRNDVPTVVSHFAKHHRGILARHLLTRGAVLPRTPEEILQAAQELLQTHYREVTLEPAGRGAHVLVLTLL